MSQEYKRGSIIEFPSMPEKEWVILNIYIDNNNQYLLVAPYNEDDSKDETENIDFVKTILIKIDEDENATVVTNSNEVKRIIDIGI
ncbi:MAG: hypothetical protein IKG56_05535 [Clostridia bacterium]|nr:hypothetical protein [Clostridia bacterium]